MDASQLSQLTDRRFSSLNRDLSPNCIGPNSHGLRRPSPPSKKRRYNPINDHYSQDKRRYKLSIERNGASNHADL